jgi:O-antigen/teichoic acid export membrane protein
MAFGLAIANLFAVPALSGLSPLVIRTVARGQADLNQKANQSLVIAKARTWIIAITILAFIVLGLGRTFLYPDAPRNNILLISALTIPVAAFTVLQSSILQGLGMAVRSQFAEWLMAPAIHLALITLLWSQGILSAITAIISSLFAAILALVFLFIQAQSKENTLGAIKFKRPDLPWFRIWFPFAALHAAGLSNAYVPMITLGLFASDTSAGAFRVAESIASMVSLPLLIVNLVSAPRFVTLHMANDREGLQKLAQSSARWAFLASLSIAIVFWSFGESILSFAYGDAYRQGYAILSLLILGQVVNVACGSVGLLLNMTGHEVENFQAFLFSLALNVILCLLLVNSWAGIGAAFASVTALIFWNLMLLWRVYRCLNIRASIF